MMAAFVSLKNMFIVFIDPQNMGIDTTFLLLGQLAEQL
jgi:hypothetical protein